MSLQPTRKVIRKIVENEAEVIKELCSLVSKISSEAINKKGSFNVGLSGGSVSKFLCEGLPSITTEWPKWKFYFCDERLVPVDHEESTLKFYLENLVPKTPLKKEQFVTVDTTLDVNSAAADYEQKIRQDFPNCEWPSFDLLLLGMGPDGHTASLFPNHYLLDENKLWIAPISDSPKPPPNRVTMTLPVINHAKVCIFAMAGKSKADMLKSILVDEEDLPCGKINPVEGELYWLLDKEAAAKL